MRTSRLVTGVMTLGLLWPLGVRGESNQERRLRILEETVRQANEEIKGLKEEIRQQKEENANVKREAAHAKTTAEQAKTTLAFPDWIKKFSIFGDIRIRHEGFYHQPHSDDVIATARNRERVRARVGVKYTYSDELSGTVRLATGDPDDPISTNETLTGSFSRKHINLDWAYITFTPGNTFGVRPGLFSVSAGKQPMSHFRVSEMLFDEDLSVEGLNETFAFLPKPCGNLDQLKLHMMQWTFNEVANAQDSWMIGGQVNPQMRFGEVVLEAGLGYFWWLNADALARNGDLAHTNRLFLVDDDPDPDVEDLVVDGYEGAFFNQDITIAATIPNVVNSMPLRLFGEYIYNFYGATDDRNGVLAGLKLGQPKTRGDWAVTALYEYLAQEAAISAFAWSDFGFGGTGVQGPVLAIDYQLLDPLTLTARSYFTTFTDRPPGVHNHTMVRLQLDAQLKF